MGPHVRQFFEQLLPDLPMCTYTRCDEPAAEDQFSKLVRQIGIAALMHGVEEMMPAYQEAEATCRYLEEAEGCMQMCTDYYDISLAVVSMLQVWSTILGEPLSKASTMHRELAWRQTNVSMPACRICRSCCSPRSRELQQTIGSPQAMPDQITAGLRALWVLGNMRMQVMLL